MFKLFNKKESKPDKKILLDLFNPQVQTYNYQAIIKQSEIALKQTSETEIEKELCLKVLRNKGAFPAIEYNCIEAKVTNRRPNEWDDLFLQLSAIYNKMIARLNSRGRIQNILNPKEIQYTWEEVKKELAAKYSPSDIYINRFVKKIDTDLLNEQFVIKSFSSDYAVMLLFNELHQTVFLENQSQHWHKSINCFDGDCMLYFNQESRFAFKDNKREIFTLNFTSTIDETKTDFEVLDRCLKENLKLDKVPVPNFYWTIDYEYDINDLFPISAKQDLRIEIPDIYSKHIQCELKQNG